MLDIKIVRENPDRIRQELAHRGMAFDFDSFLKLDEERRAQIARLDALRAEQHKASDVIRELKEEDRAAHIESIWNIKDAIGILEEKVSRLESSFTDLLLQLPNITHESVPVGLDESGNIRVRTWGKKPSFDFDPLEHYLVPAIQQLIDCERGAKISGSRFWYLKGALARLDMALMHYAFDFYAKKGFVPMITPMLVREDAMVGTGFFPADKNEIYSVNPGEDNLFLTGTAEVPLAGYHMDEVIDLSGGPLKYMGYSGCFRREAGTYGKDMKGILRGHQFNKVEMFIFCEPKDSWDMHEFLLQCSEEFMQSLGLHYQVLNMCTGDIGAPNAKKYDIETWMPGQDRYRETASCSNDTDFQARRLHTKYSAQDGKKHFVHTLNNTACADLRIIIAIIENYQQKDGSVRIPEVLHSYCGFDSISAS
jgi:seryl-tRNA synthetase